jgi:hypothetical protein
LNVNQLTPRKKIAAGLRLQSRQCLFSRVVDAVDYLLTLARLRILDALADPEPETAADQVRVWDRERIERAFPQSSL